MKTWGCECWIHVQNEHDKLNSWYEKGIFVGYTDIANQYLVYLLKKWKTVKAINSIFIKNGENESCEIMEIS